mmetsp:Transcript_10725/g.32837  ORF Transcript_10725/g.32837 Transcript_10725/m.32837 type:complete len:221 (-) Transcript_10725:55-717(-)
MMVLRGPGDKDERSSGQCDDKDARLRQRSNLSCAISFLLNCKADEEAAGDRSSGSVDAAGALEMGVSGASFESPAQTVSAPQTASDSHSGSVKDLAAGSSASGRTQQPRQYSLGPTQGQADPAEQLETPRRTRERRSTRHADESPESKRRRLAKYKAWNEKKKRNQENLEFSNNVLRDRVNDFDKKIARIQEEIAELRREIIIRGQRAELDALDRRRKDT